MKTGSLLLCTAFCALAVATACGSDDEPAPAGKSGSGGKGGSAGSAGATGGSSGKGGTGGSAGGGGSSGTGGSAGTAGTAGTAGSAGTGGDGGLPPCTAGALRCTGNTREVCNAAGTWEALPAAQQCTGAAPLCTGAGVCAGYLMSGGIDTFGPFPTQANGPTYIVTQQTLLEHQRACSSSYCVIGGIKP